MEVKSEVIFRCYDRGKMMMMEINNIIRFRLLFLSITRDNAI